MMITVRIRIRYYYRGVSIQRARTQRSERN